MNSQLADAFKLYANHVCPFVVDKLKAHYGEGRAWFEAYLQSLSERRRENVLQELEKGTLPEEVVDITHLKDVFLGQREVFRDTFKRHARVVAWVDEIVEVRNLWAHQDDIRPEDSYRTLDSIARILEIIGATEAAITVKALRDGQTRPAAPSTPTFNHLPSWWHIATPHADIRAGQFDESTFAAKLDDVVAGTAGFEYNNPQEFFRKTYLTRELRALLQDVLRRLQGKGGEAVVQLRTPFGGGKTHALIALYHLLAHRAAVNDLPVIQDLLEKNEIPTAKVAVLVGTDLSPQKHTLWGELARQLGGEDGYALVAAADRERISPSKEPLRELFRQWGPALILMDEILVYQVKAAGVRVGETTLQAQTFAFLQELSEVVGSTSDTTLVLTFPESHLEYYDQEGAAEAFARLENIFGRVQAVRVPVQGEEIYEVIRRRLFEQVDERGVEAVINRYVNLYRATKGLYEDAYRPEYHQQLRRAFPFHPELIRTLYERWGTLQGFQRTRGVLRLLARVVEENYRSPIARPLIGLGDIHFENPDLRAMVVSVLREANWEAVITSDIIGKAAQSDRDHSGEQARQRIAQTVATAIFMYSHSGGAHEGMPKPLLDLALMAPEAISRELISDALEKLRAKLFYLYEENGRFLFRAQPNLNAVLTNEMASVSEMAIREKLREYVAEVAGRGELRPIVWPYEPRDVTDDRSLKLVLYSPDPDYSGEQFRQLIQQQATGSPRLYKNTLLHLHPRRETWARVEQEARRELALEAIRANLQSTLAPSQQTELRDRLQQVKSALPNLVRASYSEFARATDAKGTFLTEPIQAYVQTSSTLVQAVVKILERDDLLPNALDPALMVQAYGLWPEEENFLPLGTLRDYFFRLPGLPMLKDQKIIAEAVIQGVRMGLFTLGLKDGERVSQIWDKDQPPSLGDIQWIDNCVLARPGVLQRPEAQEDRAKPNQGGTGQIYEPTDPTEQQTWQDAPTTGYATAIRRLRIHLEPVEMPQVPALVDLLQALKDAGGTVTLRAELVTESTTGLDKSKLALVVKELLAQHGFGYDWHEEN
ncbi:DUF499 domain-containing protein [Thermosynechococcus sp. HN-54]|uniref:DUF499 domain-containing protein n=1 Tax=Thermosynechococcus sp. HN-54 TaxID=2933959 RepID=UPI00202CFF09|nr:DUF499 domain-containing protein [Thermosynechococcus sp. HN-54]URR35773.1 DUF499 domain-containing protein [Thermosynechococcus sp. HN-54]